MAPPRRRRPLQWLMAWFRPAPQATSERQSERQQAQALIRAIDAGGLPLNPARVNHVARQLGLEVSTRAPVDQTIERIRAALQRPELPHDRDQAGGPPRR